MKLIVLFFCLFLLLAAMPSGLQAAFPVTITTQDTTTYSTAIARPNASEHKTVKRPFIPAIKHYLQGRNHYTAGLPGWPGTLALIFGIAGVVGLFIPVFGELCILFWIAAIVFGIIGLNKQKYSRNGQALAGLIMGSVCLLLAIAFLAVLFGGLF